MPEQAIRERKCMCGDSLDNTAGLLYGLCHRCWCYACSYVVWTPDLRRDVAEIDGKGERDGAQS